MPHKEELEALRQALSSLIPLTDPADTLPPKRAYWLASEIEDRLSGILRLAAKLRRNALAVYQDDEPTLFDLLDNVDDVDKQEPTSVPPPAPPAKSKAPAKRRSAKKSRGMIK